MSERIRESKQFIESRSAIRPEIGIILGTGLGGLTEVITDQVIIPYGVIPNFPVSTVQGHKGQFILGRLSGRPVAALQGRFHYYEGYPMQDVTFPVRVLSFLGVKLLILSNASGGLNPAFEIGDCMFITDHINLMGANPLLGPNDPDLGPRFPDMKEVYHHQYIAMAEAIAREKNIRYQQGIYAAVSGPTYETPAEYRYIRILGADAVGMSTVPEAIVARHMGMKVFAVSVITDLGVPGKIVEITHDEVIEAAKRTEPLMTTIITEMLNRLQDL
ncbi:MAG TPA: purine-nucleoside phosphorylase [Bacteroidales bacterium]|nr:purine-nucleoside phosphorylase [Bacteroidales bacterium]HSA43882.1 purine-nucleoside phosphorylase [Bacteroidales bacterium]